MTTIFSILVTNSQGATDGMVGTKREINAYLRSWDDPANLTAVVTTESGTIVADKPLGRKTLKWLVCEHNNYPTMCPSCNRAFVGRSHHPTVL